jgi:lipopolysaccharide export system permease protein
MMTGTLARYIGWRFLSAILVVFVGLVVLTGMIDFIEMMRRTSDVKGVSAALVARISLYRVPYLTERILPFAVMVAAMYSYLNLTRRLELVVARSAGISAWQFLWPAIAIALLVGALSTVLYNPLSASLRETSVRLEGQLMRGNLSLNEVGNGFWVRQRTTEGHAIINADVSNRQGIELTGVTVFRLDPFDRFLERIEAATAVLESGYWRLKQARVYGPDGLTADEPIYDLKTNLTPREARESFATPDTVSFWQLSAYINLAEGAGLAAAGYRVQYYRLLTQPFYLVGMVLLAASVSLRSFRFGGVQKMVLGGVVVGFLLYVLSKVTGDLSKAGLMSPLTAALLPPLVGGLTGLMLLLYQEDG